jgi:ectoine hydroxylase-related dioxygenase (phytanoyl-CoA dioxygenase family)
MYIPGSNKWTCREEVPANAPELLVPLEAEAGDIIVIDGRLWHTSGSNITWVRTALSFLLTIPRLSCASW